MHFSVRFRRFSATWLWWCCALQIGMALLGQMHQVAHAPRMLAAAAVVQALPSADAGAGRDAKSAAIERWFGDHGSNDCDLFHHLALGAGAVGAAAALVTALYAPVRNARMGAVLLRQSPALFFARGPPIL